MARAPPGPARIESRAGAAAAAPRPMAGPITQVLEEVQRGTPGAREELFRLCYAELRRLASAQMRRQRGSHTLQPTALVNEACLRMLGGAAEVFRSRGTFFYVAAKAMRSILVDLARSRQSLKRGGVDVAKFENELALLHHYAFADAFAPLVDAARNIRFDDLLTLQRSVGHHLARATHRLLPGSGKEGRQRQR